jgi:hypothetical protein
MDRELYNMQQTRLAACNTGNKDLHRSPLCIICMPGYSVPPRPVKVDKPAAQLRKLINQFNAGEREKLLAMLEEL